MSMHTYKVWEESQTQETSRTYEAFDAAESRRERLLLRRGIPQRSHREDAGLGWEYHQTV